MPRRERTPAEIIRARLTSLKWQRIVVNFSLQKLTREYEELRAAARDEGIEV